MFEARQGKELVVKLRNNIGVLSDLSKLISEKGVSILALSGSASGDDCLIRLVTNDNMTVTEALTEKGYAVHSQDVILMELPHKSGMLGRVAEALARDRTDIHHLYASALDDQERCLLVLHTRNDERALPVLNKLG
jgi:hypothetical protein